ncbi:MAG: ABC transporter six-transmembrane domain-containing protein [Bacteroidetes bacterium]|nr:ABC transporter six-transmembrane domain-containing protein [Bacteroidota bacterium]
MTFTQILKQFKFSIAIVLFFVLIENIAWIIEPTFFGVLLDALIDHFTDKEVSVGFMSPLIIWILIYLLNVLGGTLSRLYSGRVYSKMYADIATRVIVNSKKRGYPVSKILARAELAREYIVFFKDRLPEVSWQFFATGGGVIALFFYDWRIAAVAFAVIFPVVWINNIYRKNVLTLQKDIHDTREDLYHLVEEKSTAKIHQYYNSMVPPQHKIAKWNSIDYAVIKVLLMIIFIVVLFICVDVDNFSTGKIYAIVAYIWTFIASTEYLPGLMESLTSVKDLSTRLKEEDI